MDSANIERISKALANETRLLIFEAISRNKEITSSTIVTLRRVAAATVSHHLKILSHAGLRNNRAQLKVNVHLKRESREYTPALIVNACIRPRVTFKVSCRVSASVNKDNRCHGHVL